jgi:hypothetical protein
MGFQHGGKWPSILAFLMTQMLVVQAAGVLQLQDAAAAGSSGAAADAAAAAALDHLQR